MRSFYQVPRNNLTSDLVLLATMMLSTAVLEVDIYRINVHHMI